jgi:exosome complex component RRP40
MAATRFSRIASAKIRADNRLMNQSDTLLSTLAAVIPFEIAIGINGRVWTKSPSISETIAVSRFLESVDEGEVELSKSGIERAARAFLA